MIGLILLTRFMHVVVRGRVINLSSAVFCKEKKWSSFFPEIISSGISTMADVPMHMGTTRKMSYGSYNGKLSSVEGKTPFLIGVAGGTASGKVGLFFSRFRETIKLNGGPKTFVTKFSRKNDSKH